jgi:uncharacterized protein
MNAPLLALLTEAEIDDLANRLTAIQNPGSLSLEGVDGLFCALIASPDLVSPSEYLPVILGGDPGDSQTFADLADANATVSLLMRYWNLVIADFERESIHFPYVEEPGVDGILGRVWARGFMRGTRMAPEGWVASFTDEDEGQLITIPLVAGEVDPGWPSEPLTPEQRDELLQSMIVGAARAYQEFADLRREFAQEFSEDFEEDEFNPETYVRAEAKVGRNEPCPCGSGKKYKKCCG